MTSNSRISPRHYTFFDVTVSVTLPETIQQQWDLIYGNFRAAPVVASVPLELKTTSQGRAILRFGNEEKEIVLSSALVHLQDIVQNRLLSSTMSHFLFHGACWNIGGSGLVILAESGTGKSTLSLFHKRHGGDVLSDEIAAWDPQAKMLRPFPRSLAVRPHSLEVCRVENEYSRLYIDEEKALIPLEASSHPPDGFPVGGVVILEGERDVVVGDFHVFELSVVSSDDTWRTSLLHTYDGMTITKHPDEITWWRCQSPVRIKSKDLQIHLEKSGAVLTGYHHGAYRAPDYSKSPIVKVMDCAEASESMLAHLINAQALTAKSSPVQIMGEVRSMLQGVPCIRCIPGEIEATVHALMHINPADV